MRKLLDCVLGAYMILVCITYFILVLPLILLGYGGLDVKRNP